MPRPITAIIHLGAMRHNLSIVRKNAPNSKIWAVAKANAYGHGIEHALTGFSDADGMALIELDEAVRLRELGWKKPILLLQGFFETADLSAVVEHQLHVVVHCIEQIEMLAQIKSSATIHVYLKMNSGMNRLGFQPDAIESAFSRLRGLTCIGSIILMTHFANSFVIGDSPKPGISVAEQKRRFLLVASAFGCGHSFADSATVLTKNELTCAWIRTGIMLYGATVFPGRRADEFNLLPAMTLQSEVIGIQHLTAGDYVGYGSRFMATAPMTIGVVACGYTDGYPRSAPDGTPVLVDGVKTGLLGRVSMDSIMVDLTNVPSGRVGSKATLWGRGLPVEEVAAAAGTIGCELMCGLTPGVRMLDG
jgi:alanine racemase